jgi:hypothetical protein
MERTRLVLVVLGLVLCLDSLAAAELSGNGKKLLKHATAMGKKRKASAYDEKRFAKLLDGVTRDDMPEVARALRERPGATDAHRALADRVDARYWEAEYPGSSALEGFAKAVGSKEAVERRRAIAAALMLEDLTSARKLAIETASWKDPRARMIAAWALGDLVDLQGAGEDGSRVLVKLMEDPSPAVATAAAERLDAAFRIEAIDAYFTGLDDFETAKAPGRDGPERTWCFGERAFTRLRDLSRLHPAVEPGEFAKLSEDRRANVALDFQAWWTKARERFTFRRTHWETFAAKAVAKQKVITLRRPEEFFHQFRSPKDGSRVRLELTHLKVRTVGDDPSKSVVDWRLGYGMGGERNAFGTAEATGVPIHRRHGVPKQGAAWISLTVQPIVGGMKARVVVRYADFEAKN